jgi:hypothetical protein
MFHINSQSLNANTPIQPRNAEVRYGIPGRIKIITRGTETEIATARIDNTQKFLNQIQMVSIGGARCCRGGENAATNEKNYSFMLHAES